MKLLALPRYGRLAASSRLRTCQYLPWFREAGIDVKTSPFFGDGYLRDKYAGINPWRSVVAGYVGRISELITSGEFETIFVEKEALPWLPALAEFCLLPGRVRLVVDYDDATFHRYDQSPSWLVRRVLGKKLDRLMERADLVIAGNRYLAEHAVTAGCRRVEQVPTVIDLKRYSIDLNPSRGDGEVVVGWIGSPSTTHYLRPLSEVFKALSSQYNVRFVAIGADPNELFGTPFEAAEWREDTEVALLHDIDIGIMPLTDDPWARGKCGYKLIQYMACGIPVVASPVGANIDIVDSGENGFLCDSVEEWIGSLELLITNHDLRMEMGSAGRRQVEQMYCLQVQGPRLAKMLLGLP